MTDTVSLLRISNVPSSSAADVLPDAGGDVEGLSGGASVGTT
jgi:hypothetical protein